MSVIEKLNQMYSHSRHSLGYKNKNIRKIGGFRRLSKKTITKTLIYNNIQQYLNLSYDTDGKTSFNLDLLKRQKYESFICFLDQCPFIKKKNDDYEINLKFIRSNEKEIKSFINSFS